MRFTSQDLQALFDVQVSKVFKLIDGQIQTFQNNYPADHIAHLVLSGGLSKSAYVQARLKANYGDGTSAFSAARNINIHVATDPQLAVCKGLVLNSMRKGNSGKSVVAWRHCTASYGTLCKTPYDPKDPSKPTVL
jgi:hypothetical protein